jgi:hypothetical protein
MDIFTPANNAALGEGWHPLEIYGDEAFRWASDAAEVYVAVFKNVKHYLQIYLEPAPHIAKPLAIQITESGETLARCMIDGRQMVSVEVPPSGPMIRKLLLRTEGRGEPVPGDSRVLNFRVFKLTFVQTVLDIVPPDVDARMGSGWYPMETAYGEMYRWAGNDATIEIDDPSRIEVLPLVIEPGPGVGNKPFTLRVFDDSGTQIAQAEVSGRQSVFIPIGGATRRGPVSLRLHAEGGGRQIDSDRRIMNFCAHQYSSDLVPPAQQP